MVDSVTRFAGFAAGYDRVRPQPPAHLPAVLSAWAGTPHPRVVDLGAGTGLGSSVWSGMAASVIAVEPSPDMRAVAEQRLAALPDADSFTVVAAVAEETGLPAGQADLVVASMAFHWFDQDRALPEIVRLLRPGGVFAAIDHDFPPAVHAEVDAAYAEFDRRRRGLDVARGLRPPYQHRSGHLAALAGCGLFRHTREICLDSVDSGDGARLVEIATNKSGTMALLRAGVTEQEMGLAGLRETATRLLPEPTTWWWTFRVCLAVT
jgi:SAM-dependent methyltransferase